MLTAALHRLGSRVRPKLARPPWGPGLGLARTVLALSTLGTLLATSPQVLMSPLADGTQPPVCDAMAAAGVWCVVTAGHGELARWLCVVVLLVTASGWRPRLTGIAHWYVCWSLMGNVTVLDGGDQVTGVLTLLLIPVTLTDPRRWHWTRLPAGAPGAATVFGYAGLLLIQLQVAGVYLHASIAKLGVPEWADGTAMYYWLHNGSFGAPRWLHPLVDVVTGSAVGVALLTWSSIALEFALGVAVLLRPAVRQRLLVAGLLFHGGIAVTMGLASFSTAMAAALLLYLRPIGDPLPHTLVRLAAGARWRGGGPGTARAAVPPRAVTAIDSLR